MIVDRVFLSTESKTDFWGDFGRNKVLFLKSRLVHILWFKIHVLCELGQTKCCGYSHTHEH